MHLRKTAQVAKMLAQAALSGLTRLCPGPGRALRQRITPARRNAFFMNAELTNAATNGLHALCLFFYFWAALRAWQRGDGYFTRAVVGFFFLCFVLKVMGVYVHYEPTAKAVAAVWVVIGFGITLLHYFLLQALRFPLPYRLLGVLFAVACGTLGLVRKDFDFLAVEIVVFNMVAALASRGLLRWGFLGVVSSAVFWIAARKGTEAWIGRELPTAWRYDNDIFHFMLIASTFVVYKAFARGDGLPDGFGESPSQELEAA